MLNRYFKSDGFFCLIELLNDERIATQQKPNLSYKSWYNKIKFLLLYCQQG